MGPQTSEPAGFSQPGFCPASPDVTQEKLFSGNIFTRSILSYKQYN